MRRCELAGARRDLLDLDGGKLTIEMTRVVVDGKVVESDGKTQNAQRVIALDAFTLAVLAAHAELLDREHAEFGLDYFDQGLLFCWEDGRPPHPDTITRRSTGSPPRRACRRSTCTMCGTATRQRDATRRSTGRR
jgi:hypothetical protein